MKTRLDCEVPEEKLNGLSYGGGHKCELRVSSRCDQDVRDHLAPDGPVLNYKVKFTKCRGNSKVWEFPEQPLSDAHRLQMRTRLASSPCRYAIYRAACVIGDRTIRAAPHLFHRLVTLVAWKEFQSTNGYLYLPGLEMALSPSKEMLQREI